MSVPVARYWICTASQEHVAVGVQNGFAQACHGKKNPLEKMHHDDWIIYYSPTTTFKGKIKLQSFTAIGKIADEKIYQVEMFPGFKPFRRNISFFKECNTTSIIPLLQKLEFTAGKKNWGMNFRAGLFEINSRDFNIIKNCLLTHGEK